MNISFLELKKKFDNDGYFVFKNFLSKDFIVKLIEEINNAPNTVRYTDNSNNLRRLEKLYDKGKNLIDLNKKISILLKNIFNKEFLIFKDKFNIKPPGGEGFIAHYDGVFEFIDANNEKKRGWYEYGDFFVSALVAIDKCNSKNGTQELEKIIISPISRSIGSKTVLASTSTESAGVPSFFVFSKSCSKLPL